MDLLTVVMHELGQSVGLDLIQDVDASANRILETGTRMELNAGLLDRVHAGNG